MVVVVAIHMWTSGWRMRGKKDEGMVCEVSEEEQTAAVEWMR